MIRVRNLTKKYGSFLALDNVSFDIGGNRVYGFLGPNGAGKSTTMNIITGCLSATSGTVEINGTDVYDDPVAVKKQIGYLPELPPLYLDMTPGEYLEFVAEAKGVEPDKISKEVGRVMELTSTNTVSRRLIRNLSKGYKQRVGIAQALIGDPQIIILDEPTVGLDPLQIIEIRELITELGKDHTVILSSHILSEISAVCDYVMIISHGKLVASDTVSNLTSSHSGSSLLKIESRGDVTKVRDALLSVDGVISVRSVPGAGVVLSEVEYSSSVDIRDDVFEKFVAMNSAILSMTTDRLTLEDVFIRLTEENDYSMRGGSGMNTTDATCYTDKLDENRVVTDTDKENKEPDDDYKPMFGWKGDDGE